MKNINVHLHIDEKFILHILMQRIELLFLSRKQPEESNIEIA
jgi:hypothetical protein